MRSAIGLISVFKYIMWIGPWNEQNTLCVNLNEISYNFQNHGLIFCLGCVCYDDVGDNLEMFPKVFAGNMESHPRISTFSVSYRVPIVKHICV